MFKTVMMLFCVGVALLLVGCGGKINQDNYDKINTGMTRQDVEEILGEPTTVATGGVEGLAAPLPGVELDESAVILNWKAGEKMIIVNIVQDKVVSKRRRGL